LTYNKAVIDDYRNFYF